MKKCEAFEQHLDLLRKLMMSANKIKFANLENEAEEDRAAAAEPPETAAASGGGGKVSVSTANNEMIFQ